VNSLLGQIDCIIRRNWDLANVTRLYRRSWYNLAVAKTKTSRKNLRASRVYADTSVYGGLFDTEFAKATTEFFAEVQRRRFRLVTSAVVQAEMESAPLHVRKFFGRMLRLTEIANVTEAALQLQQSYLESEILTPKWGNDALHVTLATVSKCELIVSWNLTHCAFQKDSVVQCRQYIERLFGNRDLFSA
jgi:hypothetical protein